METGINHRHRQVDRTPDDAIFSKTRPITGGAQRLHVVVLRSGNNRLLDPGQHPACHPHPKRGRLVLIPTVLHDTLRTVLTEGVADNPLLQVM